jgi:hypothetical protein
VTEARTWFAANARDLLAARRNGSRPAGPVVVSLCGGGFEQTALYVRSDMPIERLDWSMLVDLEVWIWADPRVPLASVVHVTRDIAAAKPRELTLRFDDQHGTVHDIDVGSGHHSQGWPEAGIGPEHSFLWAPVNAAGTQLGRRLVRALQARHIVQETA